ncbi:unnamed protein product [Closterium sp. Yama58-4]|nr:unnamed protein product [Closterium sp. Yama58-4]
MSGADTSKSEVVADSDVKAEMGRQGGSETASGASAEGTDVMDGLDVALSDLGIPATSSDPEAVSATRTLSSPAGGEKDLERIEAEGAGGAAGGVEGCEDELGDAPLRRLDLDPRRREVGVERDLEAAVEVGTAAWEEGADAPLSAPPASVALAAALLAPSAPHHTPVRTGRIYTRRRARSGSRSTADRCNTWGWGAADGTAAAGEAGAGGEKGDGGEAGEEGRKEGEEEAGQGEGEDGQGEGEEGNSSSCGEGEQGMGQGASGERGKGSGGGGKGGRGGKGGAVKLDAVRERLMGRVAKGKRRGKGAGAAGALGQQLAVRAAIAERAAGRRSMEFGAEVSVEGTGVGGGRSRTLAELVVGRGRGCARGKGRGGKKGDGRGKGKGEGDGEGEVRVLWLADSSVAPRPMEEGEVEEEGEEGGEGEDQEGAERAKGMKGSGMEGSGRKRKRVDNGEEAGGESGEEEKGKGDEGGAGDGQTKAGGQQEGGDGDKEGGAAGGENAGEKVVAGAEEGGSASAIASEWRGGKQRRWQPVVSRGGDGVVE